MTLLIISFLAGLLTVLAPCILPLLPIIIGGSLDGKSNFKRTWIIIDSLIVSLVIFTLLLKVSTAFINIPQSLWSNISAAIITFFGLTLVFPGLWERLPFVGKLSQKSNALLGTGMQKKSIWGDVIMGLSLGPIFSTCSPTYFVILATVLPESFAKGLLYIFVYVLGLGIALFAIAVLGDKLVAKLGDISDPHGKFKKTVGIIFLIVALGIATGYDKILQQKILDAGFFDVTKIETKLLQQNANEDNMPTTEEIEAAQKTANAEGYISFEEKAKIYPQYNEIINPSGFINTNNLPITIKENIGKKIILIDFMTYSCINCVRTYPYLNDWYTKYENDGFIIIAIHTPEFAFEKNIENVKKAMAENNIKFPVVLDNNYSTWNNWKNQFWPNKFLIDIDGFVVYNHAGEGKYAETEAKIVELLNEKRSRENKRALTVEQSLPESISTTFGQSPEIYFGWARNDEYIDQSQGNCTAQKCQFDYTGNTIAKNKFALDGKWKAESEYIETQSETGTVGFSFRSKKVFMVTESMNKNSKVTIFIDGKPISKEMMGADLDANGQIMVKDSTLYEIVKNGDSTSNHLLEIKGEGVGLRIFTLTFGQ